MFLLKFPYIIHSTRKFLKILEDFETHLIVLTIELNLNFNSFSQGHNWAGTAFRFAEGVKRQFEFYYDVPSLKEIFLTSLNNIVLYTV